MIALVGLEKYKIKDYNSLGLATNPRLVLDSKAKFLKGSGIKF